MPAPGACVTLTRCGWKRRRPPRQGVVLEIIRHARGARIVDGDDVISEIRSHPGPTHTLFDVLAAAIAALATGARVAILGFAGGGIVAPLRAMSFEAPLRCVDLSLTGEKVFRKLSRRWAGDVRVDEMDAAVWLRRQRTAFDCILEDLSLPATEACEGTKPDISLDEIPALMATHLSATGVAVINMLPVPGATWDALMQPYRRHFAHVQVVHFGGYVNRVVLASRNLPPARQVSQRLRAQLHRIESCMAYDLAVRTLAAPAGRR